MEQIQVQEPEGNILEVGQTLWRIFRKARWWMLLAALVLVSAAVLAVSFLPNRYRSEARILVVEQQIPQNMVAPLSDAPVARVLEAMTQEVLSRPRLLEIISEFNLFPGNLSPDASVELMRKSISIQPIDPTREGSFNAFDIAFTAKTPEVAQAVTRKLASLFIERRSEAEAQRASTTSNFLEVELDQKRKSATVLEQRIRDFRTQYARELPDEPISNQAQAAEAQIQLQNTLTALNRAREQRAALESTLRLNLNARLTHLKEERAALLLQLTSKHPDVVKHEEQITDIEGLLANIQTETEPTEKQMVAFAGIDATIVQMLGQLESNHLEIENLSKDEKRIEATIADSQRHLALMPAREQQLAALDRELAILNQQIDGLVKMQAQSGMAAEMEKRQEGQQFRELDAATLPNAPFSPPRLKISLGALVAGIALGFLAAFLREMLNPTFHSEQEIKKRFAPPLVLSVPVLPTPAEKRRRAWMAGGEWIVGSMVAATVLAIEFFVYKHP